jgi:hypothetical protein
MTTPNPTTSTRRSGCGCRAGGAGSAAQQHAGRALLLGPAIGTGGLPARRGAPDRPGRPRGADRLALAPSRRDRVCWLWSRRRRCRSGPICWRPTSRWASCASAPFSNTRRMSAPRAHRHHRGSRAAGADVPEQQPARRSPHAPARAVVPLPVLYFGNRERYLSRNEGYAYRSRRDLRALPVPRQGPGAAPDLAQGIAAMP